MCSAGTVLFDQRVARPEKLMLAMLADVAEMERGLPVERTHGMALGNAPDRAGAGGRSRR
jgi:hypothetical protein